jgi:DNA-binding MarR family transcriptional regulator
MSARDHRPPSGEGVGGLAETISMLSMDDQIVLALRRISQAIDVWSRQLWQDYGLTSPQLAVLREVLAGQNISPGTLATALHLSQPTVTGILSRLEARGLVRRQRSSTDRRHVLVAATDEGRQLAAQAPPLLRDRFRRELSQLHAERQSEILATLVRVAEMMQAPPVDEGPFFYHDKRASPGKSKQDADHSDSPAPAES